MENIYMGCQENQTAEQKARNYKLEEVCAAVEAVNWVEKPSWVTYPIRNQDGSSQCVCMTYATEMGIIFKQKYGEFIDFSSSFPYQQRGGTYGGCNSTDIYSIFPKLGNVFESFMPSQNLHEAECLVVPRKNYFTDLAKPFIVKRIQLPIDFETVASTLQATGKGVMVWFHIGQGEWTNEPVYIPEAVNFSNHSVTAIDFLLKGGKKYIVIQDSYGLGTATNGCRLISEEYFGKRCFLSSYLKTFEILNTELVEKPHFDGTIMGAQRCFKYEGFFPSNLAEVEAWGPITTNACIAFQKRYNIVPAEGYFGPITKQKLAEIYQ